MTSQNRHCWSTAPSGVGRSEVVFALLEDWKYRRDEFSHRYKSENVVSQLCFVEISQAFRDEV